jgi:hypothetical protein
MEASRGTTSSTVANLLEPKATGGAWCRADDRTHVNQRLGR